ncbi:hypothetical protein [Emticicia sp. 17c]|uniref:hypothetical protein n=1 Tax=Emticicia sp. 17c TaxID=3127704 RepID=UPI00301D867F
MKKNPILGIGLLAGGGLLLSQMIKPPADDTDTSTSNALGFVGSEELSLEETIKKVIKGDRDLQRLLKGDIGTPGAKGDTGATGPAGAAGATLQNFGSSLLVNGAGELGTNSNWGGTGTILGDEYEGRDSVILTYDTSKHIYNTTVFDIDPRRIYKVTGFAKTTANAFTFYMMRLNKNNENLIQGGSNFVYPMFSPNFNNVTFEEKTVYFGGIGSTNTSFGLSAAKSKLSVYTTGAAVVTVNKLRLNLVPLSEPVPYNLPYLPKNQVVYDPTTYALGMYNGTAVVWT